MTEQAPIATVRSYAELRTALQKRAVQLDTTNEVIDELAGLPSRYTQFAVGRDRNLRHSAKDQRSGMACGRSCL